MSASREAMKPTKKRVIEASTGSTTGSSRRQRTPRTTSAVRQDTFHVLSYSERKGYVRYREIGKRKRDRYALVVVRCVFTVGARLCVSRTHFY